MSPLYLELLAIEIYIILSEKRLLRTKSCLNC